ncbi:MAG: hypothetical protein AAFQ79_14300 [Pseudomonadota bacterium]
MADAVLAARVLARLSGRLRLWALYRMLREAEAAGAHRVRHDRMHPIWGDGSLMAVALRRPRVAEPFLDDRAFRESLQLVLTAFDQPRAQDRHLGNAGS